MIDGVRNFLENLGMLKYYDIFCAKGFDLESDIPHLNLSDLEESLMIESYADRALIHASAQKFKPSVEFALYDWLHHHSLDHYYINFIQSELTDLKILAKIQLPNEDLYDELEMVLPGHKKRFERAVASLREGGCGNQLAETPVTQGWWGKPECLPQAKFDFLCVTANLFAFHEPENKARIDFMVDSGSDVSTVQEKTLKGLNLELIGPIYSCGIHGGNYTNLYKAVLEVGDEHLVIEVMASNYDSLGSRIVRHFRHVIDGKRHIWLRGNYQDPLPAVLPLSTPAKSTVDANVHLPHYGGNDALPQPSRLPLPPCSSSSSVQSVIQTTSPNEVDSGYDSVSRLNKQSPSRSKDCESGCNIIGRGSDTELYVSEHETNHKKESLPAQHIPISSSLSKEFVKISAHPEATTVMSPNDGPLPGSIQDPCNEEKPQKLKENNFNDSENKIDFNESIFRGTNNSPKVSGRKRPNPAPLTKLASPLKVCKVELEENTRNLKDTDDDIDNINPLLSSGRSVGYRGESKSVSGTEMHSNGGMMQLSQNNVTLTQVESQDQVIHILNESSNEEDAFLDEDSCEEVKGLEHLEQNKNFMLGLGMSVMIPLDDLENRNAHK